MKLDLSRLIAPTVEVLGARGDLDTIPFLESLKPWQTSVEPYKQQVEDHNRFMWPRYVNGAKGAIRRRHWQVVAQSEKEQPGSAKILERRATETART